MRPFLSPFHPFITSPRAESATLSRSPLGNPATSASKISPRHLITFHLSGRPRPRGASLDWICIWRLRDRDQNTQAGRPLYRPIFLEGLGTRRYGCAAARTESHMKGCRHHVVERGTLVLSYHHSYQTWDRSSCRYPFYCPMSSGFRCRPSDAGLSVRHVSKGWGNLTGHGL